MTARVAAVRRMLALLGVSTRQVVWLVLLGVVTSAFEAAGIGLLLPVLGYVEHGARVFEESRLAATAAAIAAPFGLRPGLPLLLVLASVPVVGRQVFRFLRQQYAGRVRYEANARLRRDGMAALLDADLAFVAAHGDARLAATLTTEVERCALALPMLLQLIESAVLTGVYLVLLFLVAAPLVWIVVAAMLLTAAVMRAKVRSTQEWGRLVAAQSRALQAAMTERLMGFRLVKLRGAEHDERARLDRLIDELSASQVRIGRVREALNALVEPIMLAAVFAALYVAVAVLDVGLALIGVFGLIVTRLVPVLRQLNEARLGIASLMGGLEQIAAQARHARAAAPPASGGLPFPGLRKELVFDAVGFRYGADDEGAWALRDVSFRAARGSITAIVGRSGAGKSTLLDLVPRLRQATRGEIRIDGVPLDRFEVTSLRRAIGFVDQEGFLFEGTIAENITYGAAHAAPEAIAAAARRAHAAEFIERLPEGYASQVGYQGHRLSIGQRQRLCIARTLLQDADILLLDEPTSALDGESEQHIRAVLDELRRAGKAVLVVAHRLSTIRDADQIIVLDGGRVVEHGSHEALRAQLGAYHELFDLQVRG